MFSVLSEYFNSDDCNSAATYGKLRQKIRHNTKGPTYARRNKNHRVRTQAHNINTTKHTTYYQYFHPRDYRTNRILRGDISQPRATKKLLTKPQKCSGTSKLEEFGIPFGTVHLPPPTKRSRGVRQLEQLRTNGISFGEVRLPPAKSKQATSILTEQKSARVNPHPQTPKKSSFKKTTPKQFIAHRASQPNKITQ